VANVETLGTLERRVSMALAADEIERKVDERLKKLARSVRMPGFRPGKVPLKLVAQTYGPQVRSEVMSDAVQKSFTDAVRMCLTAKYATFSGRAGSVGPGVPACAR